MNNDPNAYQNPFRVNNPLLLYIFPMFQALPTLLLILGSIPFGFELQGFVLGLMWFVVAHYVLNDEKVNISIHVLWSYGLADLLVKPSKSIPNPLVKRYYS